jgi:hypothetical protein
MHTSIGTVSTLFAPQNTGGSLDKITGDLSDNFQLALDTVDKSWTRQRVERLHMWCHVKASKCKKASICADALEKHLNETHVLQCIDFLKIAFIVNNGLLLLDEDDIDGSCEADSANVQSSTESAVDPPACEFIQFTSECIEPTRPRSECESELSMAEIEKQMNDLLAAE